MVSNLNTIVHQKKFLSKKVFTHATQVGMNRGEQTIYHIIYEQILIKYNKNEQIHVEIFQGRHFPEIEKSNAKSHTGWGWGCFGV